ncbi:acyl-CoA dehydrogenase [Haloarcula sediminis]|uniref:acyl-CoA dehydrogenase n=1 Tax=Haloarcula sediminis TaxID=3111777 RepID=UPI002D78D1E5|nr:acyl-CoA dehydrogenase [Haloarcula sp. CK38]
MTNFKSGSGNLDFDGDDESAADSSAPTAGPSDDTGPEEGEPTTDAAAQPDSATGSDTTGDGPAADSDGATYPYFVRRNNVGDERDTRLEIHVRDKVAEGEAQFRHALATQLGASDVSKTDAREFALLAAYRHPEQVAELMREEGFDSLG